MPRRNSRDPESDPAAAFGDVLRRLREAANITTQGAAGKRQRYSNQTISRWETGASVPDERQVNDLLDEYGVAGLLRDIVLGSWRLARKAKGPIPEFIQKYFAAQEKGTFLRFWALYLVPGMLQGKEYAEAMYDLPDMDSETAAETVGVRISRQSMIAGPDAPQVLAVLYEPVLYHLIGSPEVMVKQMDRLLEFSERPNVTIQVVRGKGAYWGLVGQFEVASGPAISDTMVMYTVEDQTSDELTLTGKALILFEKVRSNALNAEDSRAVIMEAREHWESRQN